MTITAHIEIETNEDFSIHERTFYTTQLSFSSLEDLKASLVSQLLLIPLVPTYPSSQKHIDQFTSWLSDPFLTDQIAELGNIDPVTGDRYNFICIGDSHWLTGEITFA